ncbi:MarR family transcriptional regulator [Microbacterium sp. STN6]|uniref:MarR family winged helix-turn-helix transcriptional regulator n=1 Tax=Microbacterium sp. STN6 TaxID=2995588 RepID=UPI002260914E|nr:MarR family transcriptional regulator [Microbacterium sp. STN6]MCX7521389.1 MarR family transcriptional regulator [Microbacterium sp. STN6]
MTDAKWLNDEQLVVWTRFVAVLQLFPAALDAQLERDAQLTHFEYFTLAMLSEAPQRTMRMTALAGFTTASLARLSRVVSNLEKRGYAKRQPCPEDRRATNVTLTQDGWQKVVATAPGHVDLVRSIVIDTLTAEELTQLSTISAKLLSKLDPQARMVATARSQTPPPV